MVHGFNRDTKVNTEFDCILKDDMLSSLSMEKYEGKKGIVDISNLNTPPEKHELMTANYFADLGMDVVFIRASNIPGVYRPDIMMDGTEWEIKSPEGKGKRTIEKIYHKAAMQSKNIIFDLRRCRIPESTCLTQLEREFKDKLTKRLLVIKKNGELVEFSKSG